MERELLGNKSSLERRIYEITGIPAHALRGCPLPNFNIVERMSLTGRRKTTCEEDQACSLLSIFDISMPVIYGEGKEKALKRLREQTRVEVKRGDFSVSFNLSSVPNIESFVAREGELAEMHRQLKSDGTRRTVVLHGLGGIGKTQLSIAYSKRHRRNYSAIFWLNIRDEVTKRYPMFLTNP